MRNHVYNYTQSYHIVIIIMTLKISPCYIIGLMCQIYLSNVQNNTDNDYTYDYNTNYNHTAVLKGICLTNPYNIIKYNFI